MPGDATTPSEPPADCPRCPRLAAFRGENRLRRPDGHNAPVASWGSPDARLLVVGLAPGRDGANQTGRPFTGDWAGDLLYAVLGEFGFTVGRYDERADDGLRLVDCLITNAVRCVPPANKPLPSEIATCRDYLGATLATLTRLRVVVALGRVAHESVVRACGARPSALPFGHGRLHRISVAGRPTGFFDSYHCSRYNTNTGVLTPAMFRSVFAQARAELDC